MSTFHLGIFFHGHEERVVQHSILVCRLKILACQELLSSSEDTAY